jgi:hypothetical protein
MKIPIDETKWIDYDGNVLVIKPDNKQSWGRFQCDGVLCKQESVAGTVVKKFKTKSKWFNPTWWYKRTSWSNDPTKIFFLTEGLGMNWDFNNAKAALKVYDKATKLARPCDKILKAMFKEIESKTGMKLLLDSMDTTYGETWCEAYLPAVDKKGNQYLITWENCD